MKLEIYCTFFFLFCLCGCHLGPKYHRPCTSTPEEWKSKPDELLTAVPCVDYWWEVFEDENLNQLEALAIQNNPNLYVAAERVAEARAQAGFSKANLYPQINFNPSYSDVGALLNSFTLFKSLPLKTIKPISQIHAMTYFLPIELNYEVDLWGKLRGQYQSALLAAKAQEESFNGALLSLTSDVAANYFNLRSLDAQIFLIQEEVSILRKYLNLATIRFQRGLVNYLDVTNAEQNLASMESQYLDFVRQRTLFENAIAVLLGVPASSLKLDVSPLVNDPPLIPPGIPSHLLIQRPDIAQAERTMASNHALIGVAYAQFLPSLNLTGLFGYGSIELKNFLSLKGPFWDVEAKASQMIFDGGRNRSNLQIAWYRFKEAYGAYQEQVLIAFQEVEDALNDVEMFAKESEKLNKAAAFATKSAELSSKRYEKGIVNLLEVLINEQAKFEAERSVINVLGAQYVSTVQLIKALGGCWDYSKT